MKTTLAFNRLDHERFERPRGMLGATRLKLLLGHLATGTPHALGGIDWRRTSTAIAAATLATIMTALTVLLLTVLLLAALLRLLTLLLTALAVLLTLLLLLLTLLLLLSLVGLARITAVIALSAVLTLLRLLSAGERTDDLLQKSKCHCCFCLLQIEM